jgi:hypothetical protein
MATRIKYRTEGNNALTEYAKKKDLSLVFYKYKGDIYISDIPELMESDVKCHKNYRMKMKGRKDYCYNKYYLAMAFSPGNEKVYDMIKDAMDSIQYRDAFVEKKIAENQDEIDQEIEILKANNETFRNANAEYRDRIKNLEKRFIEVQSDKNKYEDISKKLAKYVKAKGGGPRFINDMELSDDEDDIEYLKKNALIAKQSMKYRISHSIPKRTVYLMRSSNSIGTAKSGVSVYLWEVVDRLPYNEILHEGKVYTNFKEYSQDFKLGCVGAMSVTIWYRDVITGYADLLKNVINLIRRGDEEMINSLVDIFDV